jgi:hypothetical protein
MGCAFGCTVCLLYVASCIGSTTSGRLAHSANAMNFQPNLQIHSKPTWMHAHLVATGPATLCHFLGCPSINLLQAQSLSFPRVVLNPCIAERLDSPSRVHSGSVCGAVATCAR